MKIRSFLAFTVSGDFKEMLERILKDLQNTKADVKWVKPENIHLTLKFLGDLAEGQLEAVKVVLRQLCPGFRPITTNINAIGAFPDMRHPKVIWAGLQDPHQSIKEIFEVLETSFLKLGIDQEDHPFQSHITLGRVRSSANLKELIEKMPNISINSKISQVFDLIVLYKSTLTPDGPVYDTLEEFSLGVRSLKSLR